MPWSRRDHWLRLHFVVRLFRGELLLRSLRHDRRVVDLAHSEPTHFEPRTPEALARHLFNRRSDLVALQRAKKGTRSPPANALFPLP